MINLCGIRAGATLHAHVTRWICQFCTDGRWESGERCHHCAGTGLTDDVIEDVEAGDGIEPAVRLPRPPAVMRTPCADCAYRPGSPEAVLRADGEEIRPHDSETPFFCHHGMHRIEREGAVGYVPAAECNGMPLGYMVCAGWWDHVVEGGPALERPFRDPGGANRRADAGIGGTG
jgi:hypothetical protein